MLKLLSPCWLVGCSGLANGDVADPPREKEKPFFGCGECTLDTYTHLPCEERMPMSSLIVLNTLYPRLTQLTVPLSLYCNYCN